MSALVFSGVAGAWVYGLAVSLVFVLWVVPQVLWNVFTPPKAQVRVTEGVLVVRQGKKEKHIPITEDTRIVKGLNSIWIIGHDYREVLQYADFAEESVQRLKSLG